MKTEPALYNNSTDTNKSKSKYKYNSNYVENNIIISSCKDNIFYSNNYGNSWSRLSQLNSDKSFFSILLRNKIMMRLLRMGIHHIILIDGDYLVIFKSYEVLTYNIKNNKIIHRNKLIGSRPLRICNSGKKIYYGEYRRNKERSPVFIWEGENYGESWHPIREITNVRHIHGIFKDPYTDNLWVTTGDEDSELTREVSRL